MVERLAYSICQSKAWMKRRLLEAASCSGIQTVVGIDKLLSEICRSFDRQDAMGSGRSDAEY